MRGPWIDIERGATFWIEQDRSRQFQPVLSFKGLYGGIIASPRTICELVQRDYLDLVAADRPDHQYPVGKPLGENDGNIICVVDHGLAHVIGIGNAVLIAPVTGRWFAGPPDMRIDIRAGIPYRDLYDVPRARIDIYPVTAQTGQGHSCMTDPGKQDKRQDEQARSLNP